MIQKFWYIFSGIFFIIPVYLPFLEKISGSGQNTKPKFIWRQIFGDPEVKFLFKEKIEKV